jgi:hypothetical protein
VWNGGGHLFGHVAIEQSTERDFAGTGILGFVVQLQDKAFQVLPKSPFGFVESPVEGQRLMNPLGVLDGVVAILARDSPGSLDPPKRPVLRQTIYSMEHRTGIEPVNTGFAGWPISVKSIT